MNTHDLLELASLDALGLLDPDEREAFEHGFRTAPPALQAQIRREQLRISQMDELLPPVDVPLGLRARVLSALREAMARMTLKRSPAESGDVLAVIRPSSGVHRMWRAGALGALAATLVLGFATLQMQRDYNELTERWTSNEMVDAFNQFGPKFAVAAFDPTTKFVQFTPSGPGNGRALLLVDSKSGQVQLFTKDLPGGTDAYELVAIDRSGEGQVTPVRVLATFTNSPDGINREDVPRLSLEGVDQLALRRVGDTRLLLISATI